MEAVPRLVPKGFDQRCDQASMWTSLHPSPHVSKSTFLEKELLANVPDLQIFLASAVQFTKHAFANYSQVTAKWQFPNGGIGTMYIDLSLHGLGPIPGFRWPRCEVEHRETVVQDESLGEGGKEHVMVKRVVIWNMVMPVVVS